MGDYSLSGRSRDIAMWYCHVIHTDVTKATESRKLPLQHVDIVIYGPKSIAFSIGDILVSGKIFLQHPTHQDPNTEYKNPQVLDFEELCKKFGTINRPKANKSTLNLTLEAGVHNHEIPDHAQRDQQTYRDRAERVFNQLTRYKSLQKVGTDIKIKTPLLS